MISSLLTRHLRFTYTLAALLLVVVLVAIVGSRLAEAHAGANRQYAHRQRYFEPAWAKGVSARIETAIPTVRDGGFSSEVIWLTPATSNNYVEVGWRVESPSTSPRWYSGYVNNSGNWNMEWHSYPTVGVAYDYKIEDLPSNPGSWKIYVDGSWVTTHTTAMTTGKIVQSGGEVTKYSSSVNNAMGVSGFDFLQEKWASDGAWHYWGDWTWQHIDTDTGYTLVNYSNSKFQNYGNNP